MRTLAPFTVMLMLCAGLLASLSRPAAAADFVVIDSSEKSLNVGDVVAGDKALTVAVGAEVVLISESGERKVLTGPFSGTAGDEKANVVSALSKLIAGRSASTNFIGATRGNAVQAAKDPFAIEPARAADHCAPPGKGPELRRKPSRKSKKITLKHSASKTSATVKWPPGVASIPWPKKVPVVDGGSYVAKIGRKSAKFILHQVPDGLPSDAHRAVWMAENCCPDQARKLIASLR